MKISHYIFVLLLSSCGSSSKTDSININSLESAMKYYTASRIPGGGAALMQDGVIKEITVSGLRKNGSSDPVELEDSFQLGSCAKAMTATLAAVLIEEGHLQWDSTLSSLLPNIGIHSQYQNVTFDMLFAHRSGLRSGAEDFPNDWLFKELSFSKQSVQEDRKLFAETLLKITPKVRPGTFYYSNGGYIIAAHIMEKFMGTSWETLMREKIFLPLGMTTCGFGPTSPTGIWGHKESNGRYYPIHADNPPSYGPAVRIHCSLRDWIKFLEAHLKGFNGEEGIITSPSFKKLHTPYPGSNYTYGGWYLHERDWANGITLHHSGSNTLNYATVWIAPKKNMILVSATNSAGRVAESFIHEAIQQLIKKTMP